MQSEAVSYAYQVWRRQWRGKGKEYTSGVIVWQLNDCWPVTSWAIADYFLRPKPVYFTIARQLAPFSVGIFRTVLKNRSNDRPAQYYEFGAFQSRDATIDIWGVNGTLSARSATLEIHCIDLLSSWTLKQAHDVNLLPNQATEFVSMRCPGPPPDEPNSTTTTTHSVVVAARLIDKETGEILARFADWPQPYRYLDFPDPGLTVSIEKETSKVNLSVDKPVKGLVLSVLGKGEEVKWSDNALDIMPGDPQVVVAFGLGERAISVAYLGKERATEV